MKRLRPMRLTGLPENRARKAASSRVGEVGEIRGAGAALIADLSRGLGEFVPRADGEAVVAAIDSVAEQGAQVRVDRAVVFDGQVRDAAAGVELVGGWEGLGRADVEAGGAGAAVGGFGCVLGQVEGGEDGAEEDPVAEVAAEEVGVFALPAETGSLSEGFLHHRGGVDEDLDLTRLHVDQPAAEAFEALS